jgi:hypothetical protein
MAVQYANGKIVTDGLVLALNAADMNSYDYRENFLTYTSLIGASGSAYGSAGYNLSLITAGSVTLTSSFAPDGTNTATLISQSVSGDYVYGQGLGFSLVTSSIYTYSIFAKQGTKSDFTFTIDENGFGGKRYQFSHTFATNALSFGYVGTSGTGFIISSGSVDAGNGWRRIFGTFQTSTGSVGGFVDMIARFGSTGGTTFVWGRQLERRSSPTPYTPTLATNITASNIMYDLSGNNNSGSFISSSFISPQSNNGGALSFNGVSGSIRVNSSILVDASGSISTWAYPTAPAPAGLTNYIFSAQGTNTDRYYITFTQSSQIGIIRGNPASSLGLGTKPLNAWYNIVMTWTTSSFSGYVNGTFVTSSTYTGNGTVSNFALGSFFSPYSSQVFSGSIASTQIYNKELSAAEVLQNYNAQKSRFGLT